MSVSAKNRPTQTNYKSCIRLVGSVIILLVVFYIVPSMMPKEIKPPAYNEATLNAFQEEGRQTLLKGRTQQADRTTVTTAAGKTTYSYGGKELGGRPEWLDENNKPTLTAKDKERLVSRYEFPAPEWMRYGGRTITYAEHNQIASAGSGMFGFIGLATSVAVYYIFFWFFPAGRKPRRVPSVSFIWAALMVVLFGYLIPEYTILTSLFWPLLFFTVPLVAMFLLWALTRSGEEEAADTSAEA